MMNVSENGLNLIKKWEGCKLTAYKDSVGVWTIGWGTTNSDKSITGTEIKSGLVISQATANEWLKKSVENKYVPKVNKYSKYNFNQNQFDALVSFCYNIGSIDQLTANGTRSISEIAEHICAYCKAGGKTLQGLVNRRNDELKLYNTACSSYSVSSSATVNLKYKVGDKVTVSSYYASSTDPVEKAIIKSATGTITKVLTNGCHNPYLLNDGNIGWCNDGDIRGYAVTESYYSACASNYSSLIDALKSIGVDSSFSNRKNIAVKNGIGNYTGTATQNSQLLAKLKAGRLLK